MPKGVGGVVRVNIAGTLQGAGNSNHLCDLSDPMGVLLEEGEKFDVTLY